jgi:oxygen-independent coproporphyrinogen-3 oxidase
MQTTPTKVEHLYVHVPFCAAKCDYCAFYSEAGSAARMSDYVDAVIAELGMFCRAGAPPAVAGTEASGALALQPKTIFFGGGTPSLLPAPLMRRLLSLISPLLQHAMASEWTIECNPSTVSTEKARLFREFGVNRISMGVQALDDDLLEKIGRIHTATAAIESYEKLRRAGFDNINLDLMFGLPGQTVDQWRATLRRAIDLQPEHISTYCLILEEDTHLGSLLQQGTIKPDDELELVLYEAAIEMLAAGGYRQYEVSNFARPGRACAHNIAYWEGEDYLGLGPSACSTVGNRRWQNVPEIEAYIRAISSRRPAISHEERLTPGLRAAERAAFGMRMNAGVPADVVCGRWDKQIAGLLSAELVQWREGRLTPTKRGILFADEVAAEFV